MAYQRSYQEFEEKYLNTDDSKNYVKGVLALGCLRYGIADKADEVLKKQFEHHAPIKMKNIRKQKVCKADVECSSHETLCSACQRKFDEKMQKEVRNIFGKKNICLKNSKHISNHCDFAKCFIPIGGYEEKSKIQDIDCSGLMEIIDNNKDVQKFFAKNANSVIKWRNNIHHNELTLDKQKFTEATEEMIKFLEEQKGLLQIEVKFEQQQENEDGKAANSKILRKRSLETDDLEEDASPLPAESDGEKMSQATAASSQNSVSDTLQSDGCSIKLDEALEYLKKLKENDYCFTTQDQIKFLQETVLENTRLLNEYAQVQKDQDSRLNEHDQTKKEQDRRLHEHDQALKYHERGLHEHDNMIERLKKEIKELEETIEMLKGNNCMGNGLSRTSIDDLDQVESRFAVARLNSPSDTDNSSICSSMPSADWEDELRKNEFVLPPELKLGYVDVLILNCEEDTEDALKFQDHLQNDIIVQGKKVKAILFDGPEITAFHGTNFTQMEIGLERCNFVFIYLTRNSVNDKWHTFVRHCCLNEMLHNEKKKLGVYAVYTEKPSNEFKIPVALKSVKHFKYYNDNEHYRKTVSAVISSRIEDRLTNDEEHKMKQMSCIQEKKRKRRDLVKRQMELGK